MRLRLVSLTIFATLAVLMLVPISHARTCQDVFAKSSSHPSLSSSLVEAIHEMNRGDYRMAIEEIAVAGQKRTIVIAGERHIKSAEDAARFAMLKTHFEFTGAEGMDFKRYWFADRLRASLHQAYGKTKSMNQESSIRTLELDNQVRLITQDLADFIAAEVISNSDADAILRSIQNGEYLAHARLEAKLQPDTPPQYLRALDLVTSETLLAEINKRIKRTAKAPARSDQFFLLETGYQPNLYERLHGGAAAVSHAMSEIRWLCVATSCALTAASYAITSDPQSFVAGAVTLLGTTAVSSKGFRHFALVEFAAMDRRDAYMTRQLVALLEQNPEIDKILVVVGKEHVPGIQKRLRKRGSAGVPLE